MARPGTRFFIGPLTHNQMFCQWFDRITLYGSNGTPIREWVTTTATEDKGGTCFFLTEAGKAVTVSGTFVIEEI